LEIKTKSSDFLQEESQVLSHGLIRTATNNQNQSRHNDGQQFVIT